MTRRSTLAVALAALIVVMLAGGTWAFARSNPNDGWHHGSGPGFAGMVRSGSGSPGYGPARLGGSMMGSGGFGYGSGGFGGMMGGTSFGIAGTGKVTSLGEARTAAQRYADTLDLEVGEVMQFSENFYAELVTASGDKATEVLIDPGSGAVRVEYGPAMMWNTRYGMHGSSSAPPVRVSAEAAKQIADRWLAQHQKGTVAAEPDVFPGYDTLHTVKDGKITGMLSVNAYTGAVWYHSWHGHFVAMTE